MDKFAITNPALIYMFITWLEELLRKFPLLTEELAGAALWLWLVLPLGFLAAYAFARLVVKIIYALLRRTGKERAFLRIYVYPVQKPLALLAGALLFAAFQAVLPLGEDGDPLQPLNTLLASVAVIWLLVILISIGTASLQNYLTQRGNLTAVALIPLFRKLCKATVVALGCLLILQNWGFDTAAILAALGIGGIAVALASQKSMENLFGGVMLSLDQPIRVGEFGKYGDVMGTVTDIGLRSTRIRTLENTEISIPNAQLAAMTIENFTPRNQILFHKLIELHYDTTLEQLQYLLLQMHALISQHPLLVPGGRARLAAFNEASAVVEIWAYVNTKDWNQFVQIQEELLLRLRKLVMDAGTDLAIPSQTVYMKRGGHLDEQIVEEVKARVDTLRKEDKVIPLHTKPVT